MNPLVNPLTDSQLNFVVCFFCPHQSEQVCHFSSLSRFCQGCKTISRRAARWLIVLRPKQIPESEPKWQTCYILQRIKTLIVSYRVK